MGRGVAAVVVLLVVSLVWVGVRGAMAASSLVAGANSAVQLAPLLESGDPSGADDEVSTIQSSTARARGLTSDPVWRALEILPFLGGNLSTLREGVAAADDLSHDALDPLVALAGVIDADSLMSLDRAGRIAGLDAATANLAAIDTSLSTAAQRVDAQEGSSMIPPLADAYDEVHSRLDYYSAAASGLRSLSDVVPSLVTPAPSQPWLIAVTAERDGATVPVVYLRATTADGVLTISEAIAASSGFAPDLAAGAGLLTVDAASLQLLTESVLGTVSVPGVGELTPEQVPDFVTTGAWAQAAAPADAELAIGAFATTVIHELLS